MKGEGRAAPVDGTMFAEIQRFLADEAWLLDNREYQAWIALLTEDVSYRVSTHVVRNVEEGDTAHEIIDEDRAMLKLRVDQLSDPKLTRAENPGSLYRRFVSNIRADEGDGPDVFSVGSSLLVYKNRPATMTVELYAGERRDVLHRIDGELRIAARWVRLDQAVLSGGTLSTLL